MLLNIINNTTRQQLEKQKHTCPMERASSLTIGRSSFLRLILFSSYSVLIGRLLATVTLLTFIVIPLAKSNALSVKDKALPGSNNDERSLSKEQDRLNNYLYTVTHFAEIWRVHCTLKKYHV